MIGKLEFLIALARERNFSRAAETCGVTPNPPCRHGIKQLEDTLAIFKSTRASPISTMSRAA
jgi:DNA-binding transcriptional LysR family regulator